jgi:hypothetical protein
MICEACNKVWSIWVQQLEALSSMVAPNASTSTMKESCCHE